MKRLLIRCLFFLMPALVLTSCAGMNGMQGPPSFVSPEARKLIGIIESRNRSLRTVKGVGRITLYRENTRQTGRMAWITEMPGRLRASILNIAGQPTVSVAGDGEYFYALVHPQSKFYRNRTQDPDLSRMVSVPIHLRDVIRLLGGQTPLRAYDRASVLPDSGNGPVLMLENRWRQPVERIRFTPDRETVSSIEMLNRRGGQIYRVVLDDFQTAGNYRIPFAITVSSGEARFELRIDRCWTDTPVPPDAFVLYAP